MIVKMQEVHLTGAIGGRNYKRHPSFHAEVYIAIGSHIQGKLEKIFTLRRYLTFSVNTYILYK
jgi:hypothetical protein